MPKVDTYPPPLREREREHPKLHAKHAVHHHIFREGPSNRAPHAQDLSPRRMVEQRPATTATVFSPHSNRGQASTVALVYFKKKSLQLVHFKCIKSTVCLSNIQKQITMLLQLIQNRNEYLPSRYS